MESHLIYKLPPLTVAKTSKSKNPKTYIFIAKDEENFTVFSNERKHFVLTSPFGSNSKNVIVDVEYIPGTDATNWADYKYPKQEFEDYRLEAINYLLNKEKKKLKSLEQKIVSDIKKSFSENPFESKETLTEIDQKDEDDFTKVLKELNLSKYEKYEQLKDWNHKDSEIVEFKSKRYRRDNAIIALIKNIRGSACQLCRTFVLKRDGQPYIEAAHIIPKSEKGVESPDNIILLCPNHHKEFDLGNRNIINHTKTHLDFILNNKPYHIKFDQDFDN